MFDNWSVEAITVVWCGAGFAILLTMAYVKLRGR